MKAMSTSRRRLLARVMPTLAGIALLNQARFAVSGAGHDASVDARAIRGLRGMFRDPHSPAQLGRAYLEQTPDEADPATLLMRIVKQPHVRQQIAFGSEDDLRDWVRSRIRADFEAGALVNVRGWMIARTEARLCALCVVARG